MLPVFGLIVVLALFGLTVGIYAVRKMNPRWLRIQTRVWRVATFTWSWARRSRQGAGVRRGPVMLQPSDENPAR
jgi:hypothetical protein